MPGCKLALLTGSDEAAPPSAFRLVPRLADAPDAAWASAKLTCAHITSGCQFIVVAENSIWQGRSRCSTRHKQEM